MDELNDKPETIALARKNIIEPSYGKFDLIEDLISQDILLKAKPRRIQTKICVMLNIQKSDFNYFSFYSWLKRFRKKQGKPTFQIREAARPNEEIKNDITEDVKLFFDKEYPEFVIDDWRTYVPVKPVRVDPYEKPLIKVVRPEDYK